MSRFKINERVIVNDGVYTGVIVGIDTISYPLPLYDVKTNETGEVLPYYEPAIKKLATPDECLRYGEVLTDEQIHCFPRGKVGWVRIRTISYDNRIFYHKMVNDEVVEFKELTV